MICWLVSLFVRCASSCIRADKVMFRSYFAWESCAAVSANSDGFLLATREFRQGNDKPPREFLQNGLCCFNDVVSVKETLYQGGNKGKKTTAWQLGKANKK